MCTAMVPEELSLETDPLHPRAVLGAYAAGYFVMDEGDDDDGGAGLTFESPDPRAIVPLDAARIAKWKRRRQIGFGRFEYRMNTAFEAVLEGCAAPRDNDLTPFMTSRVLEMYRRLHALGFAHSVEAYVPGSDELAAGTLGVCLGRAHFGESTFHRVSGAGSAVIVATLDLLVRSGFQFMDIQYISTHFERWGAIEVPRDDYLDRLRAALVPR